MVDASYWANRTARQRSKAATRFDREARETIEAYKKRQAIDNRRKYVAGAVANIEQLGIALLTGKVGARDLTKEERAVCKDAVKDAWRTLKSETDFVTVL
jgi:hypothetical protein